MLSLVIHCYVIATVTVLWLTSVCVCFVCLTLQRWCIHGLYHSRTCRAPDCATLWRCFLSYMDYGVRSPPIWTEFVCARVSIRFVGVLWWVRIVTVLALECCCGAERVCVVPVCRARVVCVSHTHTHTHTHTHIHTHTHTHTHTNKRTSKQTNKQTQTHREKHPISAYFYDFFYFFLIIIILVGTLAGCPFHTPSLLPQYTHTITTHTARRRMQTGATMYVGCSRTPLLLQNIQHLQHKLRTICVAPTR